MDSKENDEDSKYCFNCRRSIPLVNHVMHTAYCHRNLKLCMKCDEPFLITEFEEHQKTKHADILCDDCSEKLDSMDLESHKLNHCPHRLQTCNYCEIDIKASLMLAHTDMCSSRTEHCNDCGQYIMLKYLALHKESHRFRKIPNVAKPILNDSPESLSSYPPLTKKVPNIAVDRNVRSTIRTTSMPTLRFHEPNISNHHRVLPPVKRNNDQPQINKFNNNTINKDSKKNISIVDIPSDDDELSIHGAHSIRNGQSSTIKNVLNNDYTNYNNMLRGVQLPCEFCQRMIDSENLVLHETGCRPDLAKLNNILHTKNKNTNYQNDRFSVPPLDLNSSNSDDSEINLNTLSLSSDEENDGEKINVEKLPCEFCEKLIPIDKLINHQIRCEKLHLDLPIRNNLHKGVHQQNKSNTNLPKSVNFYESRRNLLRSTSASIYESPMVQRLPRVKLNNKKNLNRLNNISTDNRVVNNIARNNYEQFLSNSRLNHSVVDPTRYNMHQRFNPSGGAIPKQKNLNSNNNQRVINDLSSRRDSCSSSD